MLIRILLILTLMPLPALGISLDRETTCQKILRKARRQARINNYYVGPKHPSTQVHDLGNVVIVVNNELGYSFKMVPSFDTYYVVESAGKVYANVLQICKDMEYLGYGTPVFMRGMIRGL